MNILLTGGAGYIGTELVEALIQKEEVDKIVVYDNLSRHSYSFFLGETLHKHKKLQFVQGDVLDSRKLKSILDDIDVVYHLAANVTTPFANTDPHFYEQVNHWGTAEIVYAVEESKIKRFIFTSSMGVYGASEDLINEDKEPNPKTFYGISKMRAEEHVRRLIPKMDTYILRSANVYGHSRSMRFDAVINRFVFETNFFKRISIHGTGKQSRAFIPVRLIVKALADLLTADVPSGVYNVLDKNLQVLDIVDALKTLQPELEFIFINQHLDLRNLRVDTDSRIRKYLDLENDRSLVDELEEFMNQFSF